MSLHSACLCLFANILISNACLNNCQTIANGIGEWFHRGNHEPVLHRTARTNVCRVEGGDSIYGGKSWQSLDPSDLSHGGCRNADANVSASVRRT